MGYAGYVPAKLPPSKPTEVEAAVQAVKSVETLEVMGKLLYNCAVSPREDKFRRVKLTNKKVADTIGSTHGALEAMAALGWVADEANPQELVVREGTFFSMKEVRIVEAAKERLQKDMRSSSSKNLAAMVSVQA
ncbi:hypothetical protein OEZ85_009148 [Tetradesmus obliquus]|uniref:PUB domain-containing protein n=1 Tax=Tetradesmus obliquus TaxID=3088 RepID=A0ABY8TLA8_TETOB|nr:hypothetical protein OEZ85_009148 [Tetradesmus obliquus]